MPTDLDHARGHWERICGELRALEQRYSELPGVSPRQEAERHVARLRASIAQGRMLALERSYHAHLACQEAPASYLWSEASGRGQGGKAV